MLLLLALSGCSINAQTKKPGGKNKAVSEKKVELRISAAASLQNALNDIIARFEKELPNVKINYNLGPSGALEQQISQGAPVDLFFSAAESNFEKLIYHRKYEQRKR